VRRAYCVVVVALLLSCGASQRRAGRPVVSALSDEAAAAHACRFALEVVELEGSRAPADPRAQAWRRPDDRRGTELRSGELTYAVRSVGSTVPGPADRGGARRTWEVSDGTRTVHVGDDVSDAGAPELIGDDEGALLMTFEDRGRPGRPPFAVLDGGTVVHRGELRLIDQLLHLDRTDTGWIFTRLDGETRAMVAMAIERDGETRELARVGDRENPITQGLALESHGGFALAYGQGCTVRFTANTHEGEGRVVVVDEDQAPLGHLLPFDMIAVDDGWWLVIEASWEEVHYSGGPPEWRFVHVNLRGEPVARARWPRHPAYGGALRFENGQLLARFLSGRWPPATQVDVSIRPRAQCPPPSFGRCDPRAWPGERARTTPREWAWTRDEQETVLSRRSHDVPALWTGPLTGPPFPTPPLATNDRAFVVTHHSGAAHLVTLDAADGRQLADVDLVVDPDARLAPIHLSIDGRAVVSACFALRENEPLVVLATEIGLSIHDAQGTRLQTIPGNFQECALVLLDDRSVLAAARVRTMTSTLPWAAVEVLVLSSDARSQIARHVPEAMGGNVLAVGVDDGATIVWSDISGWNRTVWQFDREGRPRGPPLHLATIYGFPQTSLEETAFGPSLLWSRWDEHGVVPLCHAEERAEPARPGQIGGSVTLPM